MSKTGGRLYQFLRPTVKFGNTGNNREQHKKPLEIHQMFIRNEETAKQPHSSVSKKTQDSLPKCDKYFEKMF